MPLERTGSFLSSMLATYRFGSFRMSCMVPFLTVLALSLPGSSSTYIHAQIFCLLDPYYWLRPFKSFLFDLVCF